LSVFNAAKMDTAGLDEDYYYEDENDGIIGNRLGGALSPSRQNTNKKDVKVS